MLTVTNPITGDTFEIPTTTELNEIVTDPNDPSDTMLEVVSIDTDTNIAVLEAMEVEEDWGE